MTSEKKSEIIKALAYGIPAVEIAAIEDVSVGEVENISLDCSDRIEAVKVFAAKKGGAV